MDTFHQKLRNGRGFRSSFVFPYIAGILPVSRPTGTKPFPALRGNKSASLPPLAFLQQKLTGQREAVNSDGGGEFAPGFSPNFTGEIQGAES